MKRVALSVLLGLAVLISGCETISGQECKSAAATGWGSIGERDGARGRTVDELISGHTARCGLLDIVPDQVAYRQGWVKGNVAYCAPDHAYSLGRAGKQFSSGVCSGDVATSIARYNEGWRIFYCSPDHAYSLGRAGESFAYGTCSGDITESIASYKSGLRSTIRKLEDDLFRLRRQSWGQPGSKEEKKQISEIRDLESRLESFHYRLDRLPR
jgi:hypothetical protein